MIALENKANKFEESCSAEEEGHTAVLLRNAKTTEVVHELLWSELPVTCRCIVFFEKLFSQQFFILRSVYRAD